LETKIKKAYNRLKELEIFSDDFETFKNFFYDNLKEDRKDEAIELLLMVIFHFFKSPGEKYNTLLKLSNEETNKKLEEWLKSSITKASK